MSMTTTGHRKHGKRLGLPQMKRMSFKTGKGSHTYGIGGHGKRRRGRRG